MYQSSKQCYSRTSSSIFVIDKKKQIQVDYYPLTKARFECYIWTTHLKFIVRIPMGRPGSSMTFTWSQADCSWLVLRSLSRLEPSRQKKQRWQYDLAWVPVVVVKLKYRAWLGGISSWHLSSEIVKYYSTKLKTLKRWSVLVTWACDYVQWMARVSSSHKFTEVGCKSVVSIKSLVLGESPAGLGERSSWSVIHFSAEAEPNHCGNVCISHWQRPRLGVRSQAELLVNACHACHR